MPFSLLVVDFQLQPLFGDYNDRQLGQQKIEIPGSDLIQEVQKREIPKEQGIIVLTRDGEGAGNFVDQLESLGYKNVYYIPGGFQMLLKEKATV